MVTWNESIEVRIIPHYSKYTKLEHSSIWYSRKQFQQMVNKNLDEIELYELLSKINTQSRVSFGKHWNIYYKDGAIKSIYDHTTSYYREKYMTKLGFNVINYHKYHKLNKKKIKYRNKLFRYFNDKIMLFRN